MVFIGFDPGQNGGVGVLSNGELVSYCPMPETRKQLLDLLTPWGSHPGTTAIVEKVGAMPKQGVSSTFKFGKGYGEILGICTALGFVILEPRPQEWKGAILKGTDKSKDASIQVCENLFPCVNLILPRHRVAHDGMAEAILLAEYGRITKR